MESRNACKQLRNAVLSVILESGKDIPISSIHKVLEDVDHILTFVTVDVTAGDLNHKIKEKMD